MDCSSTDDAVVVRGDTRGSIGYTSGMGTWDSGPFDNDAAADFLGETDAPR